MVIGSGEIASSGQVMRVFICYAREDKELLRHFEQHLTPLRKQGIIEPWYDGEIKAGSEWEEEIKRHLDAADIILLLISPGFMASDYCYSTEMTRAMERHERREAYVIPIIARPVYWHEAPFSKLQVLPQDARPVGVWPNEDEAFFNVVLGLRKVIEQVRTFREERTRLQAEAQRKADEERQQQAEIEARRKADEERKRLQAEDEAGRKAEEARRLQDEAEAQRKAEVERNRLQAEAGRKADEQRRRQSEEATRSQNARVLAQQAYNQGDKHAHEGHHAEALAAFEQAIALYPTDARFHDSRGRALASLRRHEEALAAYEQAIVLAPDNAFHLDSKANILAQLRRYDEALDVYEQAIALDPTGASHLVQKGDVLARLERYEEALAFYNRAIRLQPPIPIMRLRWQYHALLGDRIIQQLQMMATMHWHEEAWGGKSNMLQLLGRLAEAERARKQVKECRKLWREVLGLSNKRTEV